VAPSDGFGTHGGNTAPLAARAVARPQLLRRLDAAVRGKLTLIVAPPGWGKSVLCAQWAEQRTEPVGWLSFDSGMDAADVATMLAGVVTAPESDTYLVLDRLDALPAPARDALARLLILSTPRLHVVATSRVADVFGAVAADLRMRDELALLGPTDLAFDRDSARTLLQERSARALRDSDVDLLVGRTEGWPAALVFAALSLRDSRDDTSVFASRFGSHDPGLAAYIRAEMLSQHAGDVQQFLMQTAVLDRLSAPLCDAVTGRTDGEAVLAMLYNLSLIDRVDNGTFRYHSLWREALGNELRATADDGAEARLLVAAAGWHVARGEAEPAARLLIAAEDWDGVLELVSANARPMFEQGCVDTVLDWLEAVPAEHRARDHDRVIEHAILLTMHGRSYAAEDLLLTLGPAEALPLGERVVTAALRSTWVEWHLNPERAVQVADEFFALVGDVSAVDVPRIVGLSDAFGMRTLAGVARARALWLMGEVGAAREALLAMAQASDTFFAWRQNVLGALAILEAYSGHLNVAEQHARHAMRVAAETGHTEHPSLMGAHFALATVLRERNAIDRAEVVLAEAYRYAFAHRRAAALAQHTIEYGHLQLLAGRPNTGLEQLRLFRASGFPAPPVLLAAHLRAIEARLLAAIGEPNRAERALAFGAHEPCAASAPVAVQLAIARHDASGARKVLDAWISDKELASDVQFGLWDSVLVDLEGQRDEAIERLGRVVAIAEPEGHAAVFLEAGADAQRLLRAYAARHPSSYISELLPPGRPAALGTAAASTLSERERSVLSYLPSRLSNAEIASELFVSLNTIKTHLKNIYMKLGVGDRRAAVAKAEELGLL
jgi:LuxR family maltose regulon positive regulatory protein